MRTILFRGKEKETGKWLYGHYGKNTNKSWPLKDMIYPSADADAGWLHYEEIDGETLGQYTGFDDKGGKPIFEGDILRMDNFTPPNCEVRFIEGAFCLVFPEPGPAWPIDIHYIQHADKPQATVIGNIHDNPDLLEVKTDA